MADHRKEFKSWMLAFRRSTGRMPSKQDILNDIHASHLAKYILDGNASGTVRKTSGKRRTILNSGCELSATSTKPDSKDVAGLANSDADTSSGNNIAAPRCVDLRLQSTNESDGAEAARAAGASMTGLGTSASVKDRYLTKLNLRRNTWKPKKRSRASKRNRRLTGNASHESRNTFESTKFDDVLTLDCFRSDNLIKLGKCNHGLGVLKPTNTNHEAQPKCTGHNLVASLLTVKKATNNRGRKFYACPLERYEQCEFFMWEDDFGPSGITSFLEQFSVSTMPSKDNELIELSDDDDNSTDICVDVSKYPKSMKTETRCATSTMWTQIETSGLHVWGYSLDEAQRAIIKLIVSRPVDMRIFVLSDKCETWVRKIQDTQPLMLDHKLSVRSFGSQLGSFMKAPKPVVVISPEFVMSPYWQILGEYFRHTPMRACVLVEQADSNGTFHTAARLARQKLGAFLGAFYSPLMRANHMCCMRDTLQDATVKINVHTRSTSADALTSFLQTNKRTDVNKEPWWTCIYTQNYSSAISTCRILQDNGFKARTIDPYRDLANIATLKQFRNRKFQILVITATSALNLLQLDFPRSVRHVLACLPLSARIFWNVAQLVARSASELTWIPASKSICSNNVKNSVQVQYDQIRLRRYIQAVLQRLCPQTRKFVWISISNTFITHVLRMSPTHVCGFVQKSSSNYISALYLSQPQFTRIRCSLHQLSSLKSHNNIIKTAIKLCKIGNHEGAVYMAMASTTMSVSTMSPSDNIVNAAHNDSTNNNTIVSGLETDDAVINRSEDGRFLRFISEQTVELLIDLCCLANVCQLEMLTCRKLLAELRTCVDEVAFINPCTMIRIEQPLELLPKFDATSVAPDSANFNEQWNANSIIEAVQKDGDPCPLWKLLDCSQSPNSIAHSHQNPELKKWIGIAVEELAEHLETQYSKFTTALTECMETEFLNVEKKDSELINRSLVRVGIDYDTVINMLVGDHPWKLPNVPAHVIDLLVKSETEDLSSLLTYHVENLGSQRLLHAQGDDV